MRYIAATLLAASSIAAQAATGITISVTDLRGSDDDMPAYRYVDTQGQPILSGAQLPELRDPPVGTWTFSRRIALSPRTRIVITIPVSRFTEARGRILTGPDAPAGDYDDVGAAVDLGAREVVLTFVNRTAREALVGYHWRPIIPQGVEP